MKYAFTSVEEFPTSEFQDSLWEALRYSSSSILFLKSNSHIIPIGDVSDELRLFARKQALSVISNWDAPEVVKRWLLTGDENIREAANNAANSAAYRAAHSAASSAAAQMLDEILADLIQTQAA